MKKRKGYLFLSLATGERWQGDCEQWARETRRTRSDLLETRVIIYGARWACHDRRHKH